MSALTCRCRAVRHAIGAEDRRVARLAEQAAVAAGKVDLAAFYNERLSTCSTANPSPRQQRAMVAASERAGALA